MRTTSPSNLVSTSATSSIASRPNTIVPATLSARLAGALREHLVEPGPLERGEERPVDLADGEHLDAGLAHRRHHGLGVRLAEAGVHGHHHHPLVARGVGGVTDEQRPHPGRVEHQPDDHHGGGGDVDARRGARPPSSSTATTAARA